ncbi:hypothetical protein TRIUR3_32596 [Triticum urartu]|uniref:Uncharacterized protein n=1 Tax=Triticum urartu TaxID=4572 RepID=M8A4A9_TRIUA|nr:hypothetical protein TRIUR3_32596 [Triticum urartu]
MDEIMNKMGSYWLGQRANKEMSSAGDDIETRRLTVHIPAVCEVGYRDGSELRFDTTVTGTLDKGSLTGVEGLKAKVLVWARVTAVKADAAKVYFAVGIKKSRSREAYEVVRGAITVDEF